MTKMVDDTRAEPLGFARSLIEGWALVGGLLLLAVVAIDAYSIIAGAVWGRPFPGDFELTEMGTAIAAFCFLPYCQMIGANVSADIFTMKASPKAIAVMGLVASLIALGFSGILVWRMSAGLIDYRRYEEFTGILQIPIWWAFVPVVISLCLLVVASLMTLSETKSAFKRTRKH